jgi:hypothetical protein
MIYLSNKVKTLYFFNYFNNFKEMEYVGKVGKRKIYLGDGDTIERVVKLGIPEAIVVYERDWRSEIGGIRVYLEKGDWKIGHGSESFYYSLAREPLRSIDINVKRTFWEKDEKNRKIFNRKSCILVNRRLWL